MNKFIDFTGIAAVFFLPQLLLKVILQVTLHIGIIIGQCLYKILIINRLTGFIDYQVFTDTKSRKTDHVFRLFLCSKIAFF